MKIIADAALPDLSQAFPEPFKLSFYRNKEELKQNLNQQDVLLCRSTLKVNDELLGNSSLQYIATASSGIDHMDQDCLQARQIQLISAKGANATAVADYVIASVAYCKKKAWLNGKTAGIIGVGEVGSRVSQRLLAAGFKVLSYDPPKALLSPSFPSVSMEELFQCHLLCVHAHLHSDAPYPSKNLLNKDFFRRLNPGTVIINASRGGIVNEYELLRSKQALVYCADVYDNEPDVDKEVISCAASCTPHIAGHSLEAKFAAVALISRQLHEKAGLPPPVYAFPNNPPPLSIDHGQSWEDVVLSLYDPSLETQTLKQAEDLKESFIQLRKAHHFRHDFNAYPLKAGNDLLRKILGHP